MLFTDSYKVVSCPCVSDSSMATPICAPRMRATCLSVSLNSRCNTSDEKALLLLKLNTPSTLLPALIGTIRWFLNRPDCNVGRRSSSYFPRHAGCSTISWWEHMTVLPVVPTCPVIPSPGAYSALPMSVRGIPWPSLSTNLCLRRSQRKT